ncbi:MAG TPA: hypothetical protein VHR46_00465 [Gaiella sp.]|nr:hypothetical protein [Gaiella sp.]
MRLLLLAAAAVAAYVLLRRRRTDRRRVVVAWADGSELELAPVPERDRLLDLAEQALA